MRVLITNSTLGGRAGTELYVRDLAVALLRRGHSPVAFSTVLGEVAVELRKATVPVVDDLDLLSEAPDVIHGHHHLETMAAALRFPDVPVISWCHGWAPWEETPPRYPTIRRYVAVDDVCRERLVLEHGIPPERVRLLPNFVDLDRFRPRPPLPARPERALVFSNAASERTHLPAVREACARTGLSLDVAGFASGALCRAPEEVLGRYDIVFAKARGALEAMSVGTAVVLCDEVGAGPLVTSAELERLRRLNFGVRTLALPITPETIAKEIARYDPADAAAVSRRIREVAGLGPAVDRLLDLYREVVEEHATAPWREHARQASAYLCWLSAAFKAAERLRWSEGALRAERDRLAGEIAASVGERDALEGRLRQALDRIAAMERTISWRIRSRLRRVRLLTRLARSLFDSRAG